MALAFTAFVSEPFWSPALWNATEPGGEGASRIGQGERLYAQNCQPCHGAKAVGELPAQRMGGTKADGTFIAPALNGTAHAWHHPPEMLFRIVKQGSPAPQSSMKGWQGRMNDEEIRAVLAYLQSLWPEQLRVRYREMHRQG